MTYAVKSAIGRPFGENGEWVEFDILPMKSKEVLRTYDKVRLNLENPYNPDTTEGLDLEEIRPNLNEHYGTFEEYLFDIGYDSLPTTTKKYSLKGRSVRYSDLFRAGYKATPVNPNFSIDAVLPYQDKTAIHLSKPNIDYKDFFEHCLVSVNGLLHFVDYSSEGLWVMDGMKNVIRRNNNHIGIINFKPVGKIKTIKIDANMVYKHDANVPLFYQTSIDVKRDITEGVLAVSIGGYLHVLDSKTIKITGLTTFKINWEVIPLAKRIMESSYMVDFEGMGLENNNENGFVFNEDFMSDEFIINYLCSHNSFVVLIDNPELRVKRTPVEKTKLPGSYLHYEEPKIPLVTGVGRLAEYWTMEEDGLWSVDISTDACDYRHYNFKTVNLENIFAFDRKKVPNSRAELSSAYLLDIGTNYLEEEQTP